MEERRVFYPERFFDALPWFGPLVGAAVAFMAFFMLLHLYREHLGVQSRYWPRVVMIAGFVGFSVWWVNYLLSQLTFTLQEATINVGLLSLMVGLNLTTFLVERGPALTRRFTKSWVKFMDYFYLAFGFGAVIRLVNTLPRLSDRADNLDAAGLLLIAGAISVRFAKATIEVFFERHIAEDYVMVDKSSTRRDLRNES